MEKAEFVRDFSDFYVELRKEGLESQANITTLYAIYRKDLRADKFNNKASSNRFNKHKPVDPGKEAATERQKNFLMDLAYKNGVCITQKELDRMTREQTSKTINTLLGRD